MEGSEFSRRTAAVTGDGELIFHLKTRDAVLRVHGMVRRILRQIAAGHLKDVVHVISHVLY